MLNPNESKLGQKDNFETLIAYPKLVDTEYILHELKYTKNIFVKVQIFLVLNSFILNA